MNRGNFFRALGLFSPLFETSSCKHGCFSSVHPLSWAAAMSSYAVSRRKVRLLRDASWLL